MTGNSEVVGHLRCMVGAAIGGCVGYFAFGWILSQGFYAMIIPGAALGFVAGKMSPDQSTARGIVCAVLATGLGLFTEWKFFPFVKDGSLQYFILHIHDVRPIGLLMILAGGYFGYHFGMGTPRGESRHQAADVPADNSGSA